MACKVCLVLNKSIEQWTADEAKWKTTTDQHYWNWHMNELIQTQKNHKYKCKKTHKGNGVYKGAYAFTLTKSPKDELTQEQMILAAHKIMQQKSCPVKKYAFYLEKAGEEHCHIHGMYETFTEGRIEAKHFKRAWPIWDEKKSLGAGFRGGYHRPIRAEEAYSEYIAKDGGYCASNIPT